MLVTVDTLIGLKIMPELTKIFVVLDPTCMEQAALETGVGVVKNYKEYRDIDAQLHVYCCINAESVALVPKNDEAQTRDATVARVSDWLERLVTSIRSEGIAVETEVEWVDDWRKAIAVAAARQNSALVLKNMTQHSRFVRMVRDTADWTLIRECECPVFLVKTGKPFQIDSVLVAVKHNPDEDSYERANQTILDTARRMADDLGAKMHVITCYEGEGQPDRQRFADKCGLKRNQVSAASGAPEKVIAEAARERGSDLVIIARVARPESPGAVGKTARKVIDEIDTDVLVLPVAS
jgi:universal stress protein E